MCEIAASRCISSSRACTSTTAVHVPELRPAPCHRALAALQSSSLCVFCQGETTECLAAALPSLLRQVGRQQCESAVVCLVHAALGCRALSWRFHGQPSADAVCVYAGDPCTSAAAVLRACPDTELVRNPFVCMCVCIAQKIPSRATEKLHCNKEEDGRLACSHSSGLGAWPASAVRCVCVLWQRIVGGCTYLPHHAWPGFPTYYGRGCPCRCVVCGF